MDKTVSQIRQITEQLYRVRDELNLRAANEDSALSAALIEVAESDALVAFKAAVDEIRQFLWHYLSDFLNNSSHAAGDRLREYQMRRAAQLLIALSSTYNYQMQASPLQAAARDVVSFAQQQAGKTAGR